MKPLTEQDIVDSAVAVRELRRNEARDFFIVTLLVSLVWIIPLPSETRT